MSAERLTVGHILITLDPRGGSQLPPPLLDSLLDFLQLGGVVLLHDRVDGCLRLGLRTLGVFLHQVQHGAEGGNVALCTLSIICLGKDTKQRLRAREAADDEGIVLEILE